MLHSSYIIGADYHKTPLSVREQLSALSLDDFIKAQIFRQNNVSSREILLLSTCNRFELYTHTQNINPSEIIQEISLLTHIPLPTLKKILYVKHGEAMIRHGFRVVSSLESMVLGEPQILGQMKHSYTQAKNAGTLGQMLEHFCHKAFHVGKRVHHETKISKNPTSIASQALDLAIKHSSHNATILVLGAGNMGKSVLTHIQKHPHIKVLLCNRTFEKANLVSSFFPRVSPVCIEGLPSHLNHVDAVITATSSSQIILAEKHFKKRQKSLTLIDISVPRNISQSIKNQKNITLFNIDDLRQEVIKNTHQRKKHISHVDGIIEEEISSFISWTLERKNAHMIEHIRYQMEQHRKDILTKITTPEAEEATRLLLNKILHHPTLVLKSGKLSPELAEESLSLLLGVSCPRVRLLPIRGKSVKTSLVCPFSKKATQTEIEKTRGCNELSAKIETTP